MVAFRFSKVCKGFFRPGVPGILPGSIGPFWDLGLPKETEENWNPRNFKSRGDVAGLSVLLGGPELPCKENDIYYIRKDLEYFFMK